MGFYLFVSSQSSFLFIFVVTLGFLSVGNRQSRDEKAPASDSKICYSSNVQRTMCPLHTAASVDVQREIRLFINAKNIRNMPEMNM